MALKRAHPHAIDHAAVASKCSCTGKRVAAMAHPPTGDAPVLKTRTRDRLDRIGASVCAAHCRCTRAAAASAIGKSTAAAWGLAGRTSALRKPEKVCSSVLGDTTASSACGTSSGADLCEARAGLEPCRTDRASVRFAAAATNVHILRKSYSRSVSKDVNVSTTSSSNISGGARVHWHFTLSLYLRRP